MDYSFVRGVMGPIGSGKSVAMTMEIFKLACEQKPDVRGRRRTRWGVIRNTYPELTTTTINTWKEWIPEQICRLKWAAPISAKMVLPLPDGTVADMEVYFLALDKPKDVKKLLSLELTGAWVNEVREIPKAAIDMLTGRVGRFPRVADGGPSWRGIIMDTNPCDDDHWYYKLAEKECPAHYKFFRQPGGLIPLTDPDGRIVDYRANPDAENIDNLDGGYDYYRRQVGGKDPDWIKVYILGQYGSLFEGKPVYQNTWNDLVHVSTDPIKPYRGLPLILGWDFGLTPACIVGQVGPRGTVSILREYVCMDGGIREFSQNIVRPALFNDFPGMSHVSYADPAGVQRSQVDETTCIQELNRAGFRCTPAPTNEFLARRQAVLTYLNRMVDGKPGFLLDPACAILRKGFNGGYKFDRVQVSGDVRYRDVPNKNDYSHPHDALQYLMLGIDQPQTAVEPNRPPAQQDLGFSDAWGAAT